MANYFEVDSAAYEAFLQRLGFERTVFHNEVVYERVHKSTLAGSNLKIKVYTSSGIGAESARDVGKDAIRVVAIFEKEGKTYPIFKGARVYRTTSQESVEGRTSARIIDAEKRCDEWLAERASSKAPTALERERSAQGKYYGELGQQVRLTLTVKDKTAWNNKFVFTMQDDVGHTFIFWSEKEVLQPGSKYDIGGQVRGFRVFKGIRQTELWNCAGKRIQ